MVFKKSKSRYGGCVAPPKERDHRRQGSLFGTLLGMVLHDAGKSGNKKNHLLHALGPYKEFPVHRDLFGTRSSPRVRSTSQVRRQGRDEEVALRPSSPGGEIQQGRRQAGVATSQKKVASSKMKTPVRSPPFFHSEDARWNGAYDVPMVIAIPIQPNDSEDSELSLEGVWRMQPTEDERTVTPHPWFEALQPTDFDFRHRDRASPKAAEREVWPSDEDSVPRQERRLFTSYYRAAFS